MGEGWDDRDPHETGSTGTLRAEPRGGSSCKTETTALIQDTPSRHPRASERSSGRIHRRRGSQGDRRRRGSIPRHSDTNPTSPDRRHTDRTGRADGGMDEGVANTTFKPHSKAHLFRYTRTLGAPLFSEAVGDRHKDTLQGSRTGTKLLTSGLISDSFEYRHGYTRQPGSFRWHEVCGQRHRNYFPRPTDDPVCSQAGPGELTPPKKSLPLSVERIQFQETKIGD